LRTSAIPAHVHIAANRPTHKLDTVMSADAIDGVKRCQAVP
jgi:hypothetical protein